MIRLILDKLIFRKIYKESLHPLNSFTVDKGTLERAIKKSIDEIDRNSSVLRQNLIQSGVSDF